MQELEARDTKKKRSLAVASSTAGGGVGLTDDLVLEILSRVPVKSMCRFKCVSPSWRSLISHPDNRKKLPQMVTGFFYFDREELKSGRFVSLADPPRRAGSKRPSPCDFLPANTGGGGGVVDCCNGLALVLLNSNNPRDDDGSGSETHADVPYVVCNPATKKWTTVPGPGPSRAGNNTCTASIVCFDPAVSAHFHVVELLDRVPDEDDDDWQYTDDKGPFMFEGFNIYSSETGAWVFHPHSHWYPVGGRRRTYFNGLLHCVTDVDGAIAALDMKGHTCRVIPVPCGVEVGLVGHSQGRLLYANRDARNGRSSTKLSIYVLGNEEEENNGRWTLKHCVDVSGLFAHAKEYLWSWMLVGAAAIHPHCDSSIFLFDSLKGRLMSYSMDSQTHRHVICSARKSRRCRCWSLVPYVPLYLETAALENSS